MHVVARGAISYSYNIGLDSFNDEIIHFAYLLIASEMCVESVVAFESWLSANQVPIHAV